MTDPNASPPSGAPSEPAAPLAPSATPTPPTPTPTEPTSTEPTSTTSIGTSRQVEVGLLVFVVLLATGMLGFLQFKTSELVDHDSLYHVRAANILGQRGPVRMCPWMHATFLADTFADKEFLFHAVLAPFCGNEETMDRHAKVVTVVLGGLIFAAFAFTLDSLRVKHPWFWVIALLGASSDFLVRLCMVRPHLMAIALMLLGVKLALERRWLGLYFVTFVYTWSYSAPVLMPALALVIVLARAAKEQELKASSFAPVLASAIGIVSGLTLNPFAPTSFQVFYVQNVEVVLRAWGIGEHVHARLGDELGPMSTRWLLVSSPGLCLAFAVGLGALLLARRRASLRTVQLAALALVGLGLLLMSEKFMDYAAPLTLLFAASAVDDQWRDGEPLSEGSILTRAWSASYGVLVLALLTFSGSRAGERVRTVPTPALQGAARWLRDHAPAGEVVAHFYWDDFSTLFHEDRSHYYLFGLDPTFLEVTQPDALAYMDDVRTGRRELNPDWFRDSFGAKWLVVPKSRKTEITACDVAGLEPKYGLEPDETAMVYALPEK